MIEESVRVDCNFGLPGETCTELFRKYVAIMSDRDSVRCDVAERLRCDCHRDILRTWKEQIKTPRERMGVLFLFSYLNDHSSEAISFRGNAKVPHKGARGPAFFLISSQLTPFFCAVTKNKKVPNETSGFSAVVAADERRVRTIKRVNTPAEGLIDTRGEQGRTVKSLFFSRAATIGYGTILNKRDPFVGAFLVFTRCSGRVPTAPFPAFLTPAIRARLLESLVKVESIIRETIEFTTKERGRRDARRRSAPKDSADAEFRSCPRRGFTASGPSVPCKLHDAMSLALRQRIGDFS